MRFLLPPNARFGYLQPFEFGILKASRNVLGLSGVSHTVWRRVSSLGFHLHRTVSPNLHIGFRDPIVVQGVALAGSLNGTSLHALLETGGQQVYVALL